jgi:hypothetical protein
MLKITTFILLSFFTLSTLSSLGQTIAPTPTIKGVNSGEILKDSLLLVKAIDINEPFKIISYTMIYFANGTTKEYEGHSNIINKDMSEIIQKCKTGDRFFFEKIQASDNNNGILYRLKPITLTIK